MTDPNAWSLPFLDGDLLVLECAARLSLLSDVRNAELQVLLKQLLLDSLGDSLPASRLNEVMTSTGLKVELSLTPSPGATTTLLASATTKVGKAADSPPLTASLVLLTLLCADLKPMDVALRRTAFSSGAVVRAIQSLLDWTRASAPDAKQRSTPLTSSTEVSSKADNNPFDVSLIGDYAPWTDGLGPLFHCLGGWDYVWAMPQEPTNQHPGSWNAYWAPLPHLLLGRLGWADPALGLARWILSGLPRHTPELRLLHQHWSAGALMYFCHPQMDWIPEADHEGTYLAARRSGHKVSGIFRQSPLRDRFERCGGLHMRQHLSWQLLGTGTSDEHPAPVVLKSTAKRDAGERVLVLGRFGGWYRQLVDLGWGIIGPAAQETAVQVIAPPIGLVGRFQFSPTTGRWYTGPDDVHMLGN